MHDGGGERKVPVAGKGYGAGEGDVAVVDCCYGEGGVTAEDERC